MSEEVTLTQVLQAINELSQDLKTTEANLNAKIDSVEERLSGKVDQVEARLTKVEEKLDKVDTKFSIIRDEIFSTKTDVKMLQDAK